MKSLLVVLALALPIFAQDTNVHVAGVIETSANLGFANPIYGAQVGGDYRINKVVLSGDFTALRLRKNVGGSGYQVQGKEGVRFYVGKRVFVQGVTRQWKYEVEKFGKQGVDVGGGGGFIWEDESQLGIVAFNYMQEVWESQAAKNRQKTVDAEIKLYMKHHLFLSPRFAVSRFKSGNTNLTGVSLAVQVGFWFR